MPLSFLGTGNYAEVALVLLVAAMGLWLLWSILRGLQRQGSRQSELEALERIERLLTRYSEEREPVDLHRIEATLAGLSTQNARVEQALRDMLEVLDREPQTVVVEPQPQPATASTRVDWTERVTNRLLAEGYGRIQLVTSREELSQLEGDGEVQVEARRENVAYKGRVVIRSGRIVDVALRPAFEMFP